MLFAIIGDAFFVAIEILDKDIVMVLPNVMWMCACLAGMLATARLIASGPGLLNDPPGRYSYVGSMFRLALPYLAIIVGMALLVIAIHTDPSPDARLFGLLYGSVALVLLVLLRQYLVMQDNVRMAQSMRRIAWTDSLTGVYSRHYFNEMLPREMERASRYKHQLSILLLDIDGFKKYNDTYGHLQGDVVLKTIARTFSSQMRASDIIARFGGDEFVVILPETNRRRALAIADRIRSVVAAQSFGDARLSVSIGVTASRPGLTPEQLLEEADRDMYRRKNSSKNPDGRARQNPPASEPLAVVDEKNRLR
jgi:diguanylate cyclase (GGDEF)-like protein